MIELDERKEKILYGIIKSYLETGEPVGSRTISKYTDLNLSPATIRNEMSDLEELGYIYQPHTSSGRIPSDKGYRFYVDRLLIENAKKEEEVEKMQEMMLEKTEKMEHMLKQVVKVLANNTQYATMISAPSVVGNRIKFLQLSSVNENQVLAVVVMDGNVVRNRIIHLERALDSETVLKLNMLLNITLNGLTASEINLGLIAKLKEQAGIHDEIIEQVLDTVAETITNEEELEIYTSGATNIFKYPELSDSSKASELISAFEEKQALADLINEVADEDSTGIQVYIGDESPVSSMKDCSVVTATYELSEGVKGTIGIIGPKRMDYENVVDNIKQLKKELDKIIKGNR